MDAVPHGAAGESSGGLSEAERYRLLAETASDIVYAVAPDRLVTWVSPSITRGFGWQPAEIIGTRMSDLVHPDDLAWSEERRARLYAGDRAAEAAGSFILRMRRADGDYHWVKTTLTTHRDGERVVGFTGGMMIVDELVEAQERIAEQEELLRVMADAQLEPQALMEPIHDADGRLVDYRHLRVNRALCVTYGLTEAEVLGLTLTEIEPGAALNGLIALYASAAAASEPFVVEAFRYINSYTGADEYYDIRLVPVDGGRVSLSWRDVTEQVADRAQLERQATFDDLTGACKREVALREVDGARMAERSPGTSTALLFVDVDGFKEVNDTWGHGVGDDLLRTLVERVRETIRSDDVIGRMGGDEFLVLINGVHGREEALGIAEGIRRACATPVETVSGPVTATLSIGMALHEPDEAAEQWIARADRAMYDAKRSGRDRVVIA